MTRRAAHHARDVPRSRRDQEQSAQRCTHRHKSRAPRPIGDPVRSVTADGEPADGRPNEMAAAMTSNVKSRRRGSGRAWPRPACRGPRLVPRFSGCGAVLQIRKSARALDHFATTSRSGRCTPPEWLRQSPANQQQQVGAFHLLRECSRPLSVERFLLNNLDTAVGFAARPS